MADLAPRLTALGVVPVVTIDDAADAPALAAALAAGGLPVAEITFRTEAAAAAIAAMRSSRPDVLVGAGTVLDAGTGDRALDAGPAFIVAPGFNPDGDRAGPGRRLGRTRAGPPGAPGHHRRSRVRHP
ncbi:MAG: hypothetical protein WCK58_02120 [Chloroflexota bacterium]